MRSMRDMHRADGSIQATETLTYLTAVFVAVLVMSNLLANCMVQIGPWAIDAGTLTFPITYILSDVFSEVYGYRWSRRVAWLACAMNLVLAALINFAIALPHPEWFDSTPFQLAVGSSWRIVVASIVSFQLGDFLNDNVFRAMRNRDQVPREQYALRRNKFVLRAAVSSFCGQIVDTTAFCLIAFLGTMPFQEIGPMVALGIVLKTGYEIIVLPVTCKVVRTVERKENICVLR